MTTPYAGDPLLYPTTIPLVAGTDKNTPANQNTPFEGLADRTQQLFEGKPGDIQAPLGFPIADDGGFPPTFTNWAFVPATLIWEQIAVGVGNLLLFVCIMPVLQRTTGTYKVSTVEVRVNGAGGSAGAGAHGANLPETLPQITVSSRSDQVVTGHGTTVDPSTLAGAYDIPHSIVHTLTPAPVVTFWARTFYVLFEGESGANSVPNALALYDINLKLEQLA